MIHVSSNLKACAFCGADKQHIGVRHKTKTYEIEIPNSGSTIIEVDIDVMECSRCKHLRWVRYEDIERAVTKRLDS